MSRGSKKNHIIQLKVNPNDEWVDYKKFECPIKALQSFNSLKKHITNFFKGSKYYTYRLFDKKNNKTLY